MVLSPCNMKKWKSEIWGPIRDLNKLWGGSGALVVIEEKDPMTLELI